jgi:hypothetical protein
MLELSHKSYYISNEPCDEFETAVPVGCDVREVAALESKSTPVGALSVVAVEALELGPSFMTDVCEGWDVNGAADGSDVVRSAPKDVVAGTPVKTIAG